VRSAGPGNETSVEPDRFLHYKTGIWSPSNEKRDGETENALETKGVYDYLEPIGS